MHTFPQSLYLHWPFCPYKCHFCPFVAYAGKDYLMQRYHEALKKELISYAAQHDPQTSLATVFLGGGTPSTYPDNLLLDMSGTLKGLFTFIEQPEITIEVNPGTVRSEQLPLWRDVGISRLSIGVQSLNDRVLQSLNRHQSAASVMTLLEQASLYFNNISIDLIIGLPGVSEDEWQRLIHTVTTWPISHVSCYFLTVHEGTALFYRVKKQDVVLPADEGVVALYQWTVDTFTSAGFEQYEISNFARPGFQSRHNKAYWQRIPYRGCGVGACSFDGVHRWQNKKNLEEYMQAVEQNANLNEYCETISTEQELLETVMLGLRQATGLSRAVLDHHDPAVQVHRSQTIVDAQQAGYIRHNQDKIVLTPLGLAVENELVTRLLSYHA